MNFNTKHRIENGPFFIEILPEDYIKHETIKKDYIIGTTTTDGMEFFTVINNAKRYFVKTKGINNAKKILHNDEVFNMLLFLTQRLTI